ncbi:MAG: hypothetical protein U1E89_12160 [Burkholderiaceae bacterium]
MNIRLWVTWLGMWAAIGGPASAAGPGLAVPTDEPSWMRWQGRLQITADTTPSSSLLDANGGLSLARTRSAALFGDVFVTQPWFGETGGARVTSGLLVGQKGAVLGPGGSSAPTLGSVVGQLGRVPGAVPGFGDASADGVATWPYLGVGYSGASVRYGLNFSADLGLAAQNPSAIRFGRVGNAGFEEWARDLRLTPVLQLGMSYRF